jgi:hypothetical protein
MGEAFAVSSVRQTQLERPTHLRWDEERAAVTRTRLGLFAPSTV